MNPIPDRADSGTKTDQWNSRLYDCVNLWQPSEEEEFNVEINNNRNNYSENNTEDYIAVDEDECSVASFDDDKVSSLLSNALAHVYVYLDLGSASASTSWKQRLSKVIPDETCCATRVCEDGLGSGRKATYITEEDWEELRQHLEAASDFCAFHRRALFTERLLSVVTTLEWGDHWAGTVQAAAEKLVRVNGGWNSLPLSNAIAGTENPGGDKAANRGFRGGAAFIQPEDAHLVLLGMSPGDLLDRLRNDVLPLSCHRYEVCRANLRRTEQNFRLGMSSTKRKKQCQPSIGELESYWMNWLHPHTIFPSISFRG